MQGGKEGLSDNYVMREGGPIEKYKMGMGGLTRYFYIKNRGENHEKYVRRMGPTHYCVTRQGGPIEKYKMREREPEKKSSTPPIFF